MFGLFDPNYILLVMLPTLLLSIVAQIFVRAAFNRWGKIQNTVNLSGVDVAKRIIRGAGLLDVGLEATPQQGGDHFDPRTNTIRLSQDVATKPSVMSMAVVAHEIGHAQQYQENSFLIQMRSFLVPAMQLSPNIAYGLIIAGLIFSVSGLIWLGVIFFGVVVLFMLLTLPVEIDASMRGLRLLRDTGLMVSDEDQGGSRQVLTAAALTYVAAFVSALLTLLYYIMLAQSRD